MKIKNSVMSFTSVITAFPVSANDISIRSNQEH